MSFYPRHPRGWRRVCACAGRGKESVSIHATLAGGDRIEGKEKWTTRMFLSTPPSRVATRSPLCNSAIYPSFLSTPPSRVATYVRILIAKMWRCFYPRHPRGWRRHSHSHQPMRQGFYPRHPRGWRRTWGFAFVTTKKFLSTPPSRVATHRFPISLLALECFYPRHPRGWRRRLPGGARTALLRFYPRHPRGWRRSRKQEQGRVAHVSIHATLAGGDQRKALT